MIYSLVGTDPVKRKIAQKELIALGAITKNIYSENFDELESFIDLNDLFDEKIIVNVTQVFSKKEVKAELVELADRMKDSQNIFIIDEPFADIYLLNLLKKISNKSYNATVKEVKDKTVFELANLLEKRDKKNLWISFVLIKEKKGGEEIQGILWWKWTQIWKGVLMGRKSNYTKKECEEIGKRILECKIMAHRGKADLKNEIEKIILSL